MKQLIPLTKKGGSKFGEDSFLYFFPEQKIYMMNNHRLSLWCWLKFIEEDDFKKYTLIYLDQHIDCACTNFDVGYKKLLENKNRLKILDKFRELKCYSKQSLINWQNFLIFTIKLGIFKNIFLFTKENDMGGYFKRETAYEIKEEFNFKNIVGYNGNKTKKDLIKTFKNSFDIILDIDLDFFISDNNTINKKLLDNYLYVIKKYTNKALLVTISLNTSYCDGWDNAEEILSCFVKIFNLNLKIPLECG